MAKPAKSSARFLLAFSEELGRWLARLLIGAILWIATNYIGVPG